MSEEKMIFKKIPLVIGEVESVGKTHKNEQQNYKFRSIDDVYNAVNSSLSKHGITVSISYEVVKDINTTIVKEYKGERKESVCNVVVLKGDYKLFAEDGSFIECSTLSNAIDYADKAMCKAMTQCYKYFLFQVFCIPTEERSDSEYDTPEIPPMRPIKQDIKLQSAINSKQNTQEEKTPIDLAVLRIKRIVAKICKKKLYSEELTIDTWNSVAGVIVDEKNAEKYPGKTLEEKIFNKEKELTTAITTDIDVFIADLPF